MWFFQIVDGFRRKMDKLQKRNPLKTYRHCAKYIEIQGFPELAKIF